MRFDEIASMLNGILGTNKCAYYQWPEEKAPNLPYILFYYPSSNDECADNTNYASITNLNIELYTNTKDFDTERKVETVLKSNGLVYEKSEQYINQENMYEVLYESEVVIDG